MVPNQRAVKVKKAPANKNNLYAIFNLEALNQAARNLTSTVGFKLFSYLAKNQDGYSFALSSSHFCQWANCGLGAYNTAFKELCEKGYLIPQEQKNLFVFNEEGLSDPNTKKGFSF